MLLFVVAAMGLCALVIGESYLPQQAPRLAPLVHALSAQAAFLCLTSAMLLQSAWLRRQVVRQRSAGTAQGGCSLRCGCMCYGARRCAGGLKN
ncbi:hypothetical protein [Xanthomonas albilineans]|uniref:hypothetical protein n=1 Tax=Xanthomonas albilineans TaxID=29447 RepID=UPI0018B078DF|nr:hypothetical protein [Xanthomonas albilineans]